MSPESPRRTTTFAAFRVHAFRVYFAGQVLSSVGTWFQVLAAALLIVALTHSGLALGVVPALQWLPTLVLAGYGGVVTDRYDPRRVLMVTNAAAGAVAGIFAVVTAAGGVNQWWVYGLTLASGVVQCVDRPATQVIPAELVRSELLENALGLNSLVQSTSRLLGPAVAGLVYAAAGPAWCFTVNAVSYLAVLVALLRIRPAELYPRPRSARAPRQVREALRYVRNESELRVLLAVNALIGLLAFNFLATITGVVQLRFHGGSLAVGIAHAANALGAVGGGLVAGRLGTRIARRLDVVCLGFGLVLLMCALSPSLPLFVALGPLLGLSIGMYQVSVQARAHRLSDPRLLGRVLGLVALGSMGTTPIGSVLIGEVMARSSPQAALTVGAVSCVVGSCMFWADHASRRSGTTAPIRR